MAQREKVIITIEGNDKFAKAFQNLTKQTEKAEKSQKKLNKTTNESVLTYSNLQKVLLGATAIQIGRFFVNAANAAGVQEAAVNKLNTSLRLAGDFTLKASREMQNFASELQKNSTIGDETALSMLALAKSFGASNEQAKQLVQASADLSAATGISLESAVRNLGKTFSGLTGELGEIVPELKELGAEALKSGAALDFINTRFGGAALADLDTYQGRVAQLSNRLGDLRERVGNQVIPIFDFWIQKINEGIDSVERFTSPIREVTSDMTSWEKRLIATQNALERATELTERFKAIHELTGTPIQELSIAGRTFNQIVEERIALQKRVIPEIERQIQKEKELLAAKLANKSESNELTEKEIENQNRIAVAIGQMTTATFKQKKAALVAEEKLRVATMKKQIKDEVLLKKFQAASEIQLAKQKFDLKKAEIDLGLSTTQFMIGLAIDAFGKSKDLARAQLIINQALAISRATALIGIPFVGPGLFATAVGLITVATAKQFKAIGASGAGAVPTFSPPNLDLPRTDVVGRGDEDITGGAGADVVTGTRGGTTGVVTQGGAVTPGAVGNNIVINLSNVFDIDLRMEGMGDTERKVLVSDLVDDLENGIQEVVNFARQVTRTGEEFAIEQ